MEKEFIPYEQALALKELGFDEPCMAQYNHSEGFDGFGGNYRNSYFEYPDQVAAPLYQQAFRWFREKCDLDYSILPESESGHRLLTRTFNIVVYRYYMNMNVQPEILRVNGEIARYNGREEAELACLKKLIEIVKQK